MLSNQRVLRFYTLKRLSILEHLTVTLRSRKSHRTWRVQKASMHKDNHVILLLLYTFRKVERTTTKILVC